MPDDDEHFPNEPPPEMAFDGETYRAPKDYQRLKGQLERVLVLLERGGWYTLAQLAKEAGGSEASVSARLRDLRKPKYGSRIIERERIDGGLYKYRLGVIRKELMSIRQCGSADS